MLAIYFNSIWFGQIFHQIIMNGFNKAGHPIEINMIWKAMVIPSLGYIVGLIAGLFYYRKARKYIDHKQDKDLANVELKPYVLVVTIIAIIATFTVQMLTDSMIFGALAGVLVFLFLVYAKLERYGQAIC